MIYLSVYFNTVFPIMVNETPIAVFLVIANVFMEQILIGVRLITPINIKQEQKPNSRKGRQKRKTSLGRCALKLV